MNLRRSALAGAVVFAMIAVIGLGQYLSAVSRDADKEAALRRSQNTGTVAKSTAPTQGSPIPTELAIDERQPSFNHGQVTMPIMNSELVDNYTGVGWRGAGRSMSPLMGQPSFNVPAGSFDQPLWASACGITAYLPTAAAGAAGSALVDGSLVGTNNVYRNPPHVRIEFPTGFWSDLGGTGSPGFALGTVGPGGYREPFITEAVFYNNAGIYLKRQSYSFSYGYNHTNDLILMRHVLTGWQATDPIPGVDADLDGTVDSTEPVRNFFLVFNYDFDIISGNSPTSNSINENRGGDDKTPTGFFVEIVPRAVPEDLRNSGRFDEPPFGPRVYSGLTVMMDEDDPSVSGVDDYIWSQLRENFNPLHTGSASILVLEGNGAEDALGDLNNAIQRNIWGGATTGLFTAHQWWEGDVTGVFPWYLRSASPYLGSYPGDPAVSGNPPIAAQPEDRTPNSAFFTSGGELTNTTDISTWTPKAEVAALTTQWGDPRNMTNGNVAVTALGRVKGQYDNMSLFDLDGPFASVVPDPYIGSDRKEITSTTGCDRYMIGWGPFDLASGQSLTIWQADLVGPGMDGAYDVYQRALDVWMQRKYNPANDTYYWDGSNDRIIPLYNPDGTYVTDGAGVIQTETVNLGRGAASGAVFFPPPPPTLSVFATNNGTVGLAWLNNAETAIDPGTGAPDFSRYRVYRASGFIDQFPDLTVAHPIGYNSTVIPANMGVKADGSAAVTDVTDPTAPNLRANSHPYARFIQEGLVIGADYNIGRVFSFVTSTVNRFAAPGFSGPYVQIAEFAGGNTNSTNTFDPPATVRVPNPLDPEDRPPEVSEDIIETVPNARQIVNANNALGATTAKFVSSFPSRYDGSLFESFEGIDVDPRLVGKAGYVFEDASTLIGFSYWYYVASVDNESATQVDYNSFLQDPAATGSTTRTIEGLESFYTMNANGTDGRWHGTFPYRGLTVGPQVPGQEVIPTTAVRNAVTAGKAEFLDLVSVAPNPLVFQAQWDLATPGSQTVKFFNLPVPSKVTIFDVAGVRIKEFDVPGDETITIGGVTSWDLKNDSNVSISGGLYIIVIQAEIAGQNVAKTLKLYVRK